MPRQSSVLDRALEAFEIGEIAGPMSSLFTELQQIRQEEPLSWKEFARDCRNHPVCDLLHQDPFTFRAYDKPRGYAGDAVMMDYIYGLGEARAAESSATPLGREIFGFLGQCASSKGVRYRRRLLARLIDGASQRGPASVLAIAAGHLREAELSASLQTGNVREFIALDQDEASLALVANEYGHLGVKAVPGSVRQILAGKLQLGQFDFVYAAGLFDYLSAPVAAALTRRMFEMTRPGGQVLIPNFLTGVPDTGYMESFMDWYLIYRSKIDMMSLAAAVPQNELAECRIFDDQFGAITYLLLTKAL